MQNTNLNIMKTATALIVVASPSIITSQMICFLLLCTQMKIDMFFNTMLGLFNLW